MESLPDPTDFLQTTIPSLYDLDTALRCQVCKDFFTTPMTTSCAHTFCSLCIRQCLTADGKCPTCRAADQPIKLRRNVAIQETVDAWTKARAQVLEAVRTQDDIIESKSAAGKKRKSMDDDIDMESPQKNKRQTRSTTRKNPPIPLGGHVIALDSEDDGEGDEYNPDAPATPDGLVACPICNKRMREILVYAHIDTHTEKEPFSELPFSISRAPPEPLPPASPRPQHLAFLNYSMLKDKDLRKKLQELGIPAGGTRQQVQQRHTYWVNLFNSNCDAEVPRKKRDLLNNLEGWERAQSRTTGVAQEAVMAKDFDGDAWSGRHSSQFNDLIAQARAKVKQAKKVETMDHPENERTPVDPGSLPTPGNWNPLERPSTQFSATEVKDWNSRFSSLEGDKSATFPASVEQVENIHITPKGIRPPSSTLPNRISSPQLTSAVLSKHSWTNGIESFTQTEVAGGTALMHQTQASVADAGHESDDLYRARTPPSTGKTAHPPLSHA